MDRLRSVLLAQLGEIRAGCESLLDHDDYAADLERIIRAAKDLSGKVDGPINLQDGKTIRHELRTPVNQIIGYSELLMEEAEDAGDGEVLNVLEKVLASSRRVASTIDSLVA